MHTNIGEKITESTQSIMLQFAQKNIVIISAIGVVLPLLLLLGVGKIHPPGLMMT